MVGGACYDTCYRRHYTPVHTAACFCRSLIHNRSNRRRSAPHSLVCRFHLSGSLSAPGQQGPIPRFSAGVGVEFPTAYPVPEPGSQRWRSGLRHKRLSTRRCRSGAGLDSAAALSCCGSSAWNGRAVLLRAGMLPAVSVAATPFSTDTRHIWTRTDV